MTDDDIITKKILLEHMQAGFNHADQQFKKINERFERLEQRVEM